ncbi:hypothetical protein Glove_682g61 [Diversispora epigaea]|uniref:PB1 domain-containing protein n=1 Tax=Diversispora epigaea TaxID=1348612 RepID=A0A397G2H6_9GLOM|nr:hypothetical protein Glove_682g61 [Diversispora epigaea]
MNDIKMDDRLINSLSYSLARSGALPGLNVNLKQKAPEYRINLKEIDIFPTKALLNTKTDFKLSVQMRYTCHDICLFLHEMKDKVAIPLDQVIGFRITEYKETEVQLTEKFNRKYYTGNNIEVKADPTNGLLEGARSLIFIPTHSTTLTQLTTIESGIVRFKLEKLHQALMSNETVNEIYVTWVLFVERGGIVIPKDFSLEMLLDTISKRFNVILNIDRISYKNGAGELIVLRDEEDWKVAKWEASYEKKIGVEVHFT